MTDETNTPTVADLVQFAKDQKAADFEDTFNSLMADRIDSIRSEVRIDVAQSIFNKEWEEEVE